MKCQFRSLAILAGAAGVSSVLMVAVAEAQSRPPGVPVSRPPSSQTGTGSGTSVPAEAQRATRPRRPTVDIIDLMDRIEERADPSMTSDRAPAPGVVTCEAGCDGAPGKVVYAALATPPREAPSPLQQASLVDASIDAAPKPFEATCLAGCFDEPAWKHPRGGTTARPPSVVVASLTQPRTTPAAAPASLIQQPRQTARPVKSIKKASTPVVRLAAAHPPRLVSVQPEIVKKRPAKRFVAAKKSRTAMRKARHKIIRPAIQYPPRPLPAIVRVAAATSAPAPRPGAPIGPFVTSVAYAEPRKAAIETPSVAELARRALRDRALRQSLASMSSDWLNKARREAAPASRIQ